MYRENMEIILLSHFKVDVLFSELHLLVLCVKAAGPMAPYMLDLRLYSLFSHKLLSLFSHNTKEIRSQIGLNIDFVFYISALSVDRARLSISM